MVVFITINFGSFRNMYPPAAAKDILILEKLPGPILTKIENLLSIIAFFSLVKSIKLPTRVSLFLILI